MKTRIYIAAFISLLFLTFPLVHGYVFTDVVSPASDYYESLEYLKERGIIHGYLDGSFKPDRKVNRAEALKIVLRGAGISTRGIAPSNAGYRDVDRTHWYAPYVVKAKALGIASGYSNSEFRPYRNVTLEEVLAMLSNIEYEDPDLEITVNRNPYVDVKFSLWYAPHFQFAKNLNLIDPDADGKVYPGTRLTRGALAEIIYRYVYVNENELDKFPACVSCEEEVIEEEEEEIVEEEEEEEEAPEVDLEIVSFNTKKVQIKIKNGEFSPKRIKVIKGAEVSFKSYDYTLHSVVFEDFESNRLYRSQVYKHVFDEVGSFVYSCGFHTNEVGEVIVTEGEFIEDIQEQSRRAQEEEEEQYMKAEIRILSGSFVPAEVTVKEGGSITWINKDSVKHQLVFEDFEGPVMYPNTKYTREFDEAGEYEYGCKYHTNARGKVIVTE